MKYAHTPSILGGTSWLRKNGDISNIRYKVKNGVTLLNEYRYDEYSQLTKSIYYEHNDDRPIPLRYEMGFECYGSTRKGGNCATLCTAYAMSIRNAKSLNNQSNYQIDNLSYIYGTDNLRLTRVQDANTSNKNTQGHNQRSITGTAFTYDACGNVISDLHRAIDSIYYNHLHLPTKVKRLDGSKLEMTYDADGNLLCRKTYASGGSLTETRDYIGGVEMVNNEVSQINHSQGRLQKHSSSYRHEYVIKDHLGNTRVVYYNNGGTATVIDENHYYAYGLEYRGLAKTSGTATYNYMFNGIERSESFNLDFAFYRGLDPVLGVWMQVDPKAEQVIGMYPYCAMGNNPISQMDPDGDLPFLAVVGIAFATGVATNGISNLDSGENFWSNGFSAGLWSAASAAVTFGIGDVFGATGSLLKEFGRAGAHSLASGTFSHLQGGNFWHGAASGGISSLGGSWMQASGFSDPAMITGSAALGGLGSKIAGGDFWQGFATGMAIGAFNHAMHLLTQPSTTVAGIYGAGGKHAAGNPALRELVESKGGKMFTSSVGGGDNEIIEYLKAGHEKGNKLEIYGHSRGGAAAVRIANRLGSAGIKIEKITLYDPVGMYFGGSFNFNYSNVIKVTNYYQRNPIDGLFWSANNPFKGSPVSGSHNLPAINNVNLTGKYYNGVLINHINITRYAIKNP